MTGSRPGGSRRSAAPCGQPLAHSPSSSAQRLFFALWPSPAQQAALAAAVPDDVGMSGGRLVPQGNYHMTLKFLGAVTADQLPALTDIGARLAAACASQSGAVLIELDQIEFWRHAALVCAVASSPPASAGSMFESMGKALAAAGFAPEEGLFRPHVTLARKVTHLSRQPLARTVTWELGELALVQSRTLPSGSLYSTVRSWPLCREPRKRLEKKHQ